MADKKPIPLRSVRVPDDVWQAAQSRAADKGESVSAVIVRALRRYGKPSS
jgi:hypothetical protein